MSAQVLFLFDSPDAGIGSVSFEQEREQVGEPLLFEQQSDVDPAHSLFDQEPIRVEARYDEPMNSPTREELDAKLETIEARMDGRVAAIQASIDGFMGRMDERFRSMDERMGRMEEDSREAKSAIRDLKSTMIVTAISTVLAIVLGVAAFNATVLSNMVASFESGKNTAASQAEVKKQAEETAALLKQVQQQLQDSRKGSLVEPQK